MDNQIVAAIITAAAIILASLIGNGIYRSRRIKKSKQKQTLGMGDGSTAYQAGRDINIQVEKGQSTKIKLSVKVHQALFQGDLQMQYFVNVVNLSEIDVVITHVWYEDSPNIHIMSNSLPKRLRPLEPWETWTPCARIPGGADVFNRFCVRTSTGEVFNSEQDENVPSEGFIPGKYPPGTTAMP